MLNIIRNIFRQTAEQRRIDYKNFERFTTIRFKLPFFELRVNAIGRNCEALIDYIGEILDDCRFVEENKWSIIRVNNSKDTQDAIDACIKLREMLDKLLNECIKDLEEKKKAEEA